MNITLNGKQLEVEEGINLIELIKFKRLELDRIVIEFNLEIVKKEEWDKVILKENDKLEILRFVGGG